MSTSQDATRWTKQMVLGMYVLLYMEQQRGPTLARRLPKSKFAHLHKHHHGASISRISMRFVLLSAGFDFPRCFADSLVSPVHVHVLQSFGTYTYFLRLSRPRSLITYPARLILYPYMPCMLGPGAEICGDWDPNLSPPRLRQRSTFDSPRPRY